MTANTHARWGVTLLRVAVAAVFVVHGVARVSLGTVGGFGEFLSASRFPAGGVIAWVLTIVEIAGGLLLALGVAVRPLAIWFVVGAGRNGAEYSVLILAALLAVALTDSVAYRAGR